MTHDIEPRKAMAARWILYLTRLGYSESEVNQDMLVHPSDPELNAIVGETVISFSRKLWTELAKVADNDGGPPSGRGSSAPGTVL